MSLETDELDRVKQAFSHWRSQRPKKTRIPSYLWDMVEPLINEYPVSMITRALSINTAQLKENVINSKLTFVEALPVECSHSIELNKVDEPDVCFDVEFTKPCGSSLKVGRLPTSMLHILMYQFME